MVDCADGDYGDLGCSGGLPAFAFLYTDHNPLMSGEDYPYTEEEGTCAPKRLGGQCYDIPEECFRGKDITSQCGSESWMDQSPCKEGTRYV